MPSCESQIIEALRRSDRSLSTLEVTRKTGLPKTSIIKYLATFRMAGKADFEEVDSTRFWRLASPAKERTRGDQATTRRQELDSILKEFMEDAELTGFAVVDRKGSPLSAILPRNVAPEHLGALASLLFTVGIRSIELTDLEEFHQIIIEGSGGRILAYQEGKVLLIAFSKPEAMLGPLRMETEALAKRINEVLDTRKS